MSDYFSISLIVSALIMIGMYFAPIETEVKRFDVSWGIGISGITLFTLLLNASFLPKQILLTALVLISSLRLAAFLYLRQHSKNDQRYEGLKQKFGGNGLVLFLLQSVIVWLVCFPQIYVNSGTDGQIGILSIIGTLFWFVGFLFETVADHQLNNFLANPANRGRVLKTGLWKYSRHPNYFGQMLMSLGIWFFASLHFKAIISPVVIYILIKWFSGIPSVEKHMLKNVPEYSDYVKTTNVLAPWFADDHWDDIV